MDDKELETGTDYVLPKDGYVWITVGDKSVHIKHGDDGVSITVYNREEECEESVAETWACWGEQA